MKEYDLLTKSGKRLYNYYQLTPETFIGLRLGEHSVAIDASQITWKVPSSKKILSAVDDFTAADEFDFTVHPRLARFGKHGGYEIPRNLTDHKDLAKYIDEQKLNRYGIFEKILTEPSELIKAVPNCERLVLHFTFAVKVLSIINQYTANE